MLETKYIGDIFMVLLTDWRKNRLLESFFPWSIQREVYMDRRNKSDKYRVHIRLRSHRIFDATVADQNVDSYQVSWQACFSIYPLSSLCDGFSVVDKLIKDDLSCFEHEKRKTLKIEISIILLIF